jgi:hypothetical protein
MLYKPIKLLIDNKYLIWHQLRYILSKLLVNKKRPLKVLGALGVF